MEEMQIFSNPEFGQVRVVTIKGEPWFVGRDVAAALGYSNARDAISKHVDADDKDVAKCDTLGGTQKMAIVNESGLYALIFGSKLDSAKQFKRWVTSEVLPSIRKNGGYIAGQETLSDDALLAKAILVAQRKIKERDEKIEFLNKEMLEQRELIEQMEPKVSYYDLILQCKDLIPTTIIAKDYGMSAKTFNVLLNKYGVQYCQSGVWVLYAKYQAEGYTKTKTHNYVNSHGEPCSKQHSYWTQKGRLFLYDFLKKAGILPLIERDVPAAM